MKQTIQTILIVALATLLSCCANDDKQIRTAAQGYLDAMGNYRPTDARAFATRQTCDITLSFCESLVKHTDPSVYANNIPAEITLGDIDINDTVAVVAFHKHTPSMEQDGTINVVKRDGKWQVEQIIAVPPALRAVTDTSYHGRKFTDEEIAEMRRNNKKGNVKEISLQN